MGELLPDSSRRLTAVSDVEARWAFCESNNQFRLGRALDQLRSGQRRFVRLLPSLLSLNHHQLPGHVSGDACGGIQGFIPDKAELDELAQRFSADIKPAHFVGRPQIASVALMGSIGTLGHGRDSDLDIWVIHRPGLSEPDQTSLRKRLAGIGLWGELLGLNVQLFLVDPHHFADQDPIDGHPAPILLDEFYRTAIVLAGGFPAGWMIPPQWDDEHSKHCTELNRMLPDAKALVDFGGLKQPDPQVMIEFALGQLIKAIHRPWKAILKLNLAHHYATQPFDLLSRHSRQQLIELRTPQDPYAALVGVLLDQAHASQQTQRINLIQRAFYFKTATQLSSPSPLTPTWQTSELRRLVKDWGWDSQRIRTTDQIEGRNIASLQRDYRALVEELTDRFQSILRFCRQRGLQPQGSKRVDVVARQLFARFEAKPGKVEQINTGLADTVRESQLHIARSLGGGWKISTDATAESAVAHFDSMAQMAIWLHINSVIDVRTQIHLQTPDAIGEQFERLMLDLNQLFNEDDPVRDAFELPSFSHRQLYILSAEHLDTEFGLPRLKRIEVISQNSWGEHYCQRYQGRQGFYDALTDGLINLLESRVGTGFTADIRVRDQHHIERPELSGYMRLLEDCADFFARPDFRSGQYIFRIDGCFYAMTFHENRPRIEELPTMASLMHFLQQPKRLFCRTHLDPSTGITGDLLQACAMAEQGRVTYLIRHHDSRATVWCIDELGSIYRFTRPCHDPHVMTAQLLRFTQRCQWRQLASLAIPDPGHWDADIQCFELKGQYPDVQFGPIDIAPDVSQRSEFDVQVIGRWNAMREIDFEWRVAGQSFSELSHGASVLTQVKQAIQGLRASGSDYPAHVSDLELPRRFEADHHRPMQTSEYLIHKHALEARLSSI